MLCCICKSHDHKAIDCRYSWYRRPTRVQLDEDPASDRPRVERPGRPEPPQPPVEDMSEEESNADERTANVGTGAALPPTGTAEALDPQSRESLDPMSPDDMSHLFFFFFFFF